MHAVVPGLVSVVVYASDALVELTTAAGPLIAETTGSTASIARFLLAPSEPAPPGGGRASVALPPATPRVVPPDSAVVEVVSSSAASWPAAIA